MASHLSKSQRLALVAALVMLGAMLVQRGRTWLADGARVGTSAGQLLVLLGMMVACGAMFVSFTRGRQVLTLVAIAIVVAGASMLN